MGPLVGESVPRWSGGGAHFLRGPHQRDEDRAHQGERRELDREPMYGPGREAVQRADRRLCYEFWCTFWLKPSRPVTPIFASPVSAARQVGGRQAHVARVPLFSGPGPLDTYHEVKIRPPVYTPESILACLICVPSSNTERCFW